MSLQIELEKLGELRLTAAEIACNEDAFKLFRNHCTHLIRAMGIPGAAHVAPVRIDGRLVGVATPQTFHPRQVSQIQDDAGNQRIIADHAVVHVYVPKELAEAPQPAWAIAPDGQSIVA